MVSEPEPFDRQRTQTEIAACLEQLGPAEDVDALAVREVETQRVETAARHGDAEARPVVRILQREEDRLPALVAPQFGDFALDPYGREPLQPFRDAAVEGRDGVDLAVAVLDCLDLGHRSSSMPRAVRAKETCPPSPGWVMAGTRNR